MSLSVPGRMAGARSHPFGAQRDFLAGFDARNRGGFRTEIVYHRVYNEATFNLSAACRLCCMPTMT